MDAREELLAEAECSITLGKHLELEEKAFYWGQFGGSQGKSWPMAKRSRVELFKRARCHKKNAPKRPGPPYACTQAWILRGIHGQLQNYRFGPVYLELEARAAAALAGCH